MLRIIVAGAGLLWGGLGAAPAKEVALEDLLRPAQYESLSISPDGKHFAATVPLADRTVLSIVRRSDMQISAQIDPGREGYVDNAFWVGDRRLFAEWSKRFGVIAQPYGMGYMLAIDVDGSNRRGQVGAVVDPLVHDEDRMLVAVCVRQVANGCTTRLIRRRTDAKGSVEPIVDGPVPNATFMADRAGMPRFSWATDDDDRQQVFMWRTGTWQLINDEAASGVEVTPIGTSYDRRYGWLWTEQVDGPDVIERIDFESGARRIVARHPQRDPSMLLWSFDGSEPIAAVFGDSERAVMFFDEAHPHARLTRDLVETFPGELARVTSTTRDGRWAVVTVTGDREPGRYYLLDVPSGRLTFLTASRPWLRIEHLSSSVPVEIPARDGTVLHGFLTRPAAARGAPAPLVVLPHGGPFDLADEWLFDEQVQLLAAHGYAVLRVNFRGSAGRGRSFVEAGYREWGRRMQDDLTDATRWALGQAGIDGPRACIWGASYGGYAALMGVAKEPALYGCAIGFAGPYDLPTMYEWGDVRRSQWGKKRLALTLGDDHATLRANSPTAHAGRIEAAVMLVQGGRDERVPAAHARAMAAALDRAGKPYATYFPKGEAHGIFDRENRLEYYRRVLEFLNQHLRGRPRSDAEPPAA